MASDTKENRAPVHTVADYFLLRTMEGGIDCITTVKLQKLLYYAQGFSFATRQRSLFTAVFEAWAKGPVCVSIYDRFKTNALYGVIDTDKMATDPVAELSKEDILFLDKIWDKFAFESSDALVRMTHQEKPWRKAYGNTPAGYACNTEIKVESIQEYFKDMVL